MEPILLSQEQALELRQSGSVMSVKRAHSKLAELRTRYTDANGENTIQNLDLSDSDFAWRCYVANRSDAMLAQVIGPGVTRFELRFLNIGDKTQNNTDAISS